MRDLQSLPDETYRGGLFEGGARNIAYDVGVVQCTEMHNPP